MNVTCPNCASVFRVDPSKIPEGGVRARCSICSAVFAVRHEENAPERPAAAPASTAAAPTAPPAPAPMIPRAEPVRPAPPASPLPPSASPPATPRPASFPPPAVPMGAPRPPVPGGPSAPAAPASRPAVGMPAAPPAPPPAPRPAASTGSRPVNPFLSQDPALKARRLARALISDMVVYHPTKRQDGLRDGNLKELFEEEIRKSWEEYADQVGKDVADGTPYFKEALNEILAGGRQIF